MINKTIILLTTILLLISCSPQKKLAKLFEDGYTEQQSFKVEIPFEYKLGLMFIKVELNNKTYDFILDSGAANILSKELAEALGRKGLLTVNVGGHQSNFQPMDFTTIEALSIGGIKFEETAAGIGDFNQSKELSCLKIDGIIGANLMRLAVWEIDFSNQIITITNTKESLALGAKTKKIPFYTDAAYKAYFSLRINGIEEKWVLIDLGSNGGFNLSYSNYDKIQKELSKNKKALEYGYPGSGYYGFGTIDSTYYLQVDRFSMGAIDLDNQILRFSKSVTPTIGTAFLKNYDVVLNWKDKEILLSPHTPYDNQKLTHNGITINYEDGALKIASLIKESEAETLGIQLGDKIIQLNGKDYAAITQEAYCDLIVQLIGGNNQIKNIVISRDGEELSFDLKNKVIIE